MNRRTKVLAALFLFVALLIGWPVGSHYRAQWRLRIFDASQGPRRKARDS